MLWFRVPVGSIASPTLFYCFACCGCMRQLHPVVYDSLLWFAFSRDFHVESCSRALQLSHPHSHVQRPRFIPHSASSASGPCGDQGVSVAVVRLPSGEDPALEPIEPVLRCLLLVATIKSNTLSLPLSVSLQI